MCKTDGGAAQQAMADGARKDGVWGEGRGRYMLIYEKRFKNLEEAVGRWMDGWMEDEVR